MFSLTDTLILCQGYGHIYFLSTFASICLFNRKYIVFLEKYLIICLEGRKAATGVIFVCPLNCALYNRDAKLNAIFMIFFRPAKLCMYKVFKLYLPF